MTIAVVACVALYAIAAVASIAFVARTRRFVTALIGSGATLFAIERSVSIFGYLYPRAFGWLPSDVQSPDAPDTLLSLILSLAIAFGLCMVGLLISLFVFSAARGPALRTKIDD